MKERKRIAAILRAFADDVEKSASLDKYKDLEVASIYVYGKDSAGIQVPVIIRSAAIDMHNNTPSEKRDEKSKKD